MTGLLTPEGVTTSVPPKAGRREWIGLGVIALPCLLYSMDLTVLNLALPRLSADLKPTSTELLWIVDIYGFILAGFLVPMGTLGDHIGRRRLLMIGAAAFGAASVCAAFAPNAHALIATRAVLGVAGATLAPSTLSLIRNMFLDEGERTKAIGVWITSYSVGGAIGPLAGGLLLDHFWWGSVFLIGVPVMVLLLTLGPILLPEFRDPNAGQIDWPSVALSLITVLSVIYGIKQLTLAFTLVSPIAIGFGLCAGVLFVRRQRTLADPVIPPGLFANRAFAIAIITYTMAALVSFGVYVYVGQYLQLVRGLTPLGAGLATLPVFLGYVIGSFISPPLANRIGAVQLMMAGLFMGALGFALLALANEHGSIPVVVAAMWLYSIGLSPLFTLATNLVVGSAPPERAGAASALSETGAELGGALGVALIGCVGNAVYHHDMTSAVPAAVSASAAESARSTLGGAVALAERIAGPAGAELADRARSAFMHALSVSSWVCAALSLAMIAALFASLRRQT